MFEINLIIPNRVPTSSKNIRTKNTDNNFYNIAKWRQLMGNTNESRNNYCNTRSCHNKSRKITRLVHTMRMIHHRAETSREVVASKPRNKWIDDVEEDPRNTRIIRWRRLCTAWAE